MQPDDVYDPRRTRPARHVDPRARRTNRGDDVDTDGEPLPDIPTLYEIERRIVRCDEALARLVSDHYSAAQDAATAEAAWKEHRDRVLVLLANRGEKEAADIREARAKTAYVDASDPDGPKGEDLYRTYKIHEARERSIDRTLRAVQTRMTGLMALAKSITSAGG